MVLVTVPAFGEDKRLVYLGVQTCANASCHSADRPWLNSTVQQNEMLVWSREDRHARAYRTLTTEASQRMARNLGLDNAATAPLCLDCHASNVPAAQRGPLFDLADGVQCERCHGGASTWLGPHVADTGTHRANVAAGLFPTDDPVARAQLCIGCHLRADHRLYGAGHPRMAFELDTFSVNQPAHFLQDADYELRKGASNGAKLWAVGQAVAATALLEAMTRPGPGWLPELGYFDCHSCHRVIAAPDEAVRDSGRYRALPSIDDSGLIMVGIIAEVMAPDLAQAIRAETAGLRDAAVTDRPRLAEAAQRLDRQIRALLPRLATASFDGPTRDTIIRAIAREGQGGAFRDFADAEQAVMAIASMVATARREQRPASETIATAERTLDSLYGATQREDTYRPAAFQQAIARLVR